MQVPTAMSVSVVPLMVQTAVVLEVKITGSPDEEEAIKASGAIPKV